MPIYSLCCGGREVGSREPKICNGCGQRVYQTTLKTPPAGGGARWNGIGWEAAGSPRVPPPSDNWYPSAERERREREQRYVDPLPHTPRTAHTEVSYTESSPSHRHPVSQPGAEGPLLAAVSPLDDLTRDLEMMLGKDDGAPQHSPFRNHKDTQTRRLEPMASLPPPESVVGGGRSTSPSRPADVPLVRHASFDDFTLGRSPASAAEGGAAGLKEVEIVNLHSEPQYNGCRGSVVAQVGADEYLVRLHAHGALGGKAWQGVLGGRGAVPQHSRALPWEEGDRLITRRKLNGQSAHSTPNSTAFADVPRVNSMAVPGSLEIERAFSSANLKTVKISKHPSTTSTVPAQERQSHVSAFQSVSSGGGRGPWEGVMGVRGRPPSQDARDGRDLPWGTDTGARPRAKSPSCTPRTPRASRSKTPGRAGRLGSKSPSCVGCGRSTAEGGERPFNAYPLRSKSRSQSRPPGSAGAADAGTMEQRERRRLEVLRQRLAAVEGNVMSTYTSPPQLHEDAWSPAAKGPRSCHSPSPSPALGSPRGSSRRDNGAPYPYRMLAEANSHYSPVVLPLASALATPRLKSPEHGPASPPRSVAFEQVFGGMLRGSPRHATASPPMAALPTASPRTLASDPPQHYSPSRASGASPLREQSPQVGHGTYDASSQGLLGMVRKQEISMDAASLPGGNFVCAEIQRQLQQSLRKNV